MEAQQQTVNLTWEALFNLVRKEREHLELQPLDLRFFDHVIEYLREKQRALETNKYKTDIFSATARDTLVTQIKNIRHFLKMSKRNWPS